MNTTTTGLARALVQGAEATMNEPAAWLEKLARDLVDMAMSLSLDADEDLVRDSSAAVARRRADVLGDLAYAIEDVLDKRKEVA